MIIKRTAKISILSLLLVVAIMSAAPLVLADEPTPRLPKMGPFVGPGDTDPFVGGYFDIDMPSAITKKVRITVSFPNTSPSVIPADNYIAGGMFLQGKGDAPQYTDYGWVASLSLDREGKFQYNMGFYETYESLGQCYWIIWKKAIVLDGVNPSTPVTLTMEWGEGSVEGYVEWFYTIDGNKCLADRYNVWGYRSTIIPYFYIGTFYDPTPLPSAYGGAYYQFGIYSETEILNSGWTVRLEQPQYYASDDQWRLVFKAKFVQGTDSYMDHWWKWGGEDYGGVWARYYGHDGNPGTLPRFEVEFYYAWGMHLPSGWVVWDIPSIVWLTPWTSSSEDLYWDNVILEYAAETNNNIEIRREAVSRNSLHGAITVNPDMISMPAMWIPEFVDSEMLAEPSADVQEDVRANWTEVSKNAVEYIHTIWGYPTEYDSLALVYNKQILEQVAQHNATVADALDILNRGGCLQWGDPTIGYGDFEKVAEACTDYGESGFMNRSGWYPLYGGNPHDPDQSAHDPEEESFQFMSMLWSNGGEYVDLGLPKALFNSLGGVEVLELYSWSHHKTWVHSLAGSGIWRDAWIPPNYAIAMMIMPTWMGSYIKAAMGDEFNDETLGIAPVPRGPSLTVGVNTTSLTYGWVNVVSKGPRAGYAWDFLKWINTPKPNASDYGPTPDEHNVTRMGEFLISDMTIPSRISDQANFDILQEDFWLKGFIDIGEEYGRADTNFRTAEEVQLRVSTMCDNAAWEGDSKAQADAVAAYVGPYNPPPDIGGILPIPGDLVPDNIVDIFDVGTVAVAFGAEPGDDNWNPRADPMEPYGLVDIFDIALCAVRFGLTNGLHGSGSSTLSTTLEKFMALGEGAASVSVCPSQVMVSPYESFSVNVTITDAANLYGFEYKLAWNKTLLQCTSRELNMPSIWRHYDNVSGEWVNDYNIVKNVIQSNATHQWHWLAISALAPAPAFTGNWTFCEYTFKAKATGTSSLSLQAKLCNMEVEAIPVTLVDGSVTVNNFRYMRSDQHTVNGLTAYKLGATQSNTSSGYIKVVYGRLPVYWGIRVWVRHVNGTEAELTGGMPVAQVSRSSDGYGLQTSTWNCTETQLALTDAVVVRVYMKFGSGSWDECAKFATAQLGAEKLENSMWAISLYTQRTSSGHPPQVPYRTSGYFYWGTTTRNSHIQNIQYT